MTSTIAAVHTAAITLEAHPDLVVSGGRGTHARSDFLLVRVVSADGREGFGEVSATPLWSGEDALSAEHFIRTVLTPCLIGQPLDDVAALERRMELALAANWFTRSGVSMALWDLHARTRDLPLADVLGGVVRRSVPVKMSVSGDDERLRQTLSAARARGFTAYKVKVGLGVAADLRRVALARELAGEDFLACDANGGWTADDARRALPRLAELGVVFLEQPVATDDLAAMARCRGSLPVVADESVFGPRDLEQVVQAGAADAVSVYIGKAAGPARAVALARRAADNGLGVVIGSNGEFGVGAAAQLHVACALPHLAPWPHDVIGAHYYTEDVLEVPLDNDGKRAVLPAGPGLGVRPRPDLLERFR